ncbi:MAG: hypothetical protein J1E85_02925 [Ruminococcus sp.]|nr:hypothetical protein [Ruminococcus sp.]
MKNYFDEIKNRLDSEDKYRERLFCRAYLFTDSQIDCLDSYPFYGKWNICSVGKYKMITHPLVGVFNKSVDNIHIIMVGHAYNPFTGETDENNILNTLVKSYINNYSVFLDKLDELTGVFALFIVVNDRILAVQDCAGQKMLYFGNVNDALVITSVPQLAGDVFGLEVDEDIERLVSCKGYYRGSGFLPGNKSPYKELKRLGPNTVVRYENKVFRIERIFPRNELEILKNDDEKTNKIEEMHRLFSSNIELTIKKWSRVGISLTGGVDSKTTFANAKPWYGDFFCYSFISKESEKIDADAAAEICSKTGIEHHLYKIPDDENQIKDYDFLQKILEHNTSYLCKLHPNEKRKYICMERENDIDVEIKSDVSEIGRAYTNRKYYKVNMPRKLTPRHFTIGQARYFFEPWEMHYADKSYESFMRETGLVDDIMGYTMHDLSYWEIRMGAWASTSFASQEYFHEITIPYNNRKLLEMFLQFPESERKADIPHMRLMRRGNPQIADITISVKDSYFGNKRMMAETLYYYYATLFNKT